jgi:hypothetical protein
VQLRCLAFSYTTLFGVKNITLTPNTGLFLAYILNYQAFTVVRPDPSSPVLLFGAKFKYLLDNHVTPSGVTQNFIFFRFIKQA